MLICDPWTLCPHPESPGCILLVYPIKLRPTDTNFNSPLMVGENGPGFSDYQTPGTLLVAPGPTPSPPGIASRYLQRCGRR